MEKSFDPRPTLDWLALQELAPASASSLRRLPAMLRVFACVSGQELLAVSTEELGDVKTLKSRLRELHGFPLCLQRLVKDGQVLDDSLQLEAGPLFGMFTLKP